MTRDLLSCLGLLVVLTALWLGVDQVEALWR